MHFWPEHYIDAVLITKEPVKVFVYEPNLSDLVLPAHTIICRNGKHSNYRTKGVVKGPGFKTVYHIAGTSESPDQFLFPLLEQHLFTEYPVLDQVLYGPTAQLRDKYSQSVILTDLDSDDGIKFYQNFFKQLPFTIYPHDHFPHIDISDLYFMDWGTGGQDFDKVECYKRSDKSARKAYERL